MVQILVCYMSLSRKTCESYKTLIEIEMLILDFTISVMKSLKSKKDFGRLKRGVPRTNDFQCPWQLYWKFSFSGPLKWYFRFRHCFVSEIRWNIRYISVIRQEKVNFRVPQNRTLPLKDRTSSAERYNISSNLTSLYYPKWLNLDINSNVYFIW